MFIPLGTDRPLRRPTLINHWLIGVNLAVFMVDMTLRSFAPDLNQRVISPLVFSSRHFHIWSIVTYQFLHADFLHILFNMLFLYVFGPNVEDRFGRLRYLAFYLVGGSVAAGLFALFEDASMIGASGSIAAVTGAYLVLFPKTHIRTLLFFFLIGVFQVPAIWFIGFAIAKDVVMQSFSGDGGVAHMAHIGGYLFGAGVSLFLLATGLLEREPYDLFSIGRQAHRRRVFKELTSRGRDPWRGDLKPVTKSAGGRRGSRIEREEQEEARQRQRAEVTRLLADGEMEQGAEAYKRLLLEYEGAALHRDAQLDVANHFFQSSDHDAARKAYTLFLKQHGRDAEAPRVRLMLGLIYARYQDDAAQAKALLEEAQRSLRDPKQKKLAETLLEELDEKQR